VARHPPLCAGRRAWGTAGTRSTRCPPQLREAVVRYRELCARAGRPAGRVVARVFPPGLPPGPECDALLGDDVEAASAQLAGYAAAGADELIISWTEVGADRDDILARWGLFAQAIGRRP
jgi:hypothetical protein